MKKAGLLTAVLFTFFIAGAQVKEGTIVYESQTDIHNKIPESMRGMMPSVITTTVQLIFKDSIAVYATIPEEGEDGGGVRMMHISSTTFNDLASGVSIEQTDFSGTTYRVIDTLGQLRWKLIPDSVKTIARFVCKKATGVTKDGKRIQAWYTESILQPIGPMSFGGLPGAILALDINNGEQVFTTKQFTTSIEKDKLQKPVKGKIISRKDYADKIKSAFGGDGSTRIMTFGN